jgi:hypothetical protein
MPFNPTCITVAFLLAWPLAVRADSESEKHDAAVAAIEALGGKVGFDENKRADAVLLEGRQVTDAALEHLKSLPQLRIVRLFRTSVGDDGMATLKSLKSVISLEVTGPLTDKGLEHIGAMTQLTSLNLPSTRHVTDAGLLHLKGLTNLEMLTLKRCGITDAGLPALKGMTKLQHLSLYETAVSDAGIDHLVHLKNLQLLVLKRTDVTDAGGRRLQEALPDCIVGYSPRT